MAVTRYVPEGLPTPLREFLQGVAADIENIDPAADGTLGADGASYETIFAATNSTVFLASQLPLNSWGYESPGTRGGLTWSIDGTGLSATATVFWRCQRKIAGAPDVGDAVVEQWRTPRVIGRFGRDGTDGDGGIDGLPGADGTDGADALGFEYVYAAHTAISVSSNQRPANSWGYDSSATRNGVAWQDGAPGLTAANPYLLQSQRQVVGAPEVGDTVAAPWTEPVVVGRFGSDGLAGSDGVDGADGDAGIDGIDGADGSDGADGADSTVAGPQGPAGADGTDGQDGLDGDGDAGVGYEFIFAVTNTSTIEQSKRPSDAWGYDSPVTVDGLTWHDAAPAVESATPNLWMSQRQVVGLAEVGEAVPDTWTTPTVVGRYGPDGEDALGLEYIFAAHSGLVVLANQLPSNTWGYDSPETRNGWRGWTPPRRSRQLIRISFDHNGS